jgi:hypothetical protein
MKEICKVCKKIKSDVKLRFVGKENQDPEPPFTQKQLVLKTLLMCESCYLKFKNGEINIVLNTAK